MRFHIELRWRVPLFAVAASLAALLVVALAGASAGRTTAESIEGTWNYGSGQILVTPSGAGAFVGVVTRTATFSAGCPHPVGEKIWQLRGSGLHYEGTHQGFGTGGCSDTRTFPATWDVTETSGAYAARECVTITVDNNRLDCQTLERAKPPAPTTPTGGKFKPGKGLDIAIAIDTTGSMGSSIAQAQEDARKLVRDVKKFAPDVAFSVVQFRDKGDVPEYNVEQVMTANAAAVEAALNRLAASGGGDYPEAYGLAFRNLRDPAVGWRASSRKLVVVIGDAEPHGAGTAGFKGCVDTSADPYGVDTKAELAGLNGLGFTLIMIRQASTASTSLECYQSLVKLAYKGGAARNGGEDVLGVVEALIEKAVVKDTKAPVVKALASSGKAGTKVKLRYRVSDASGKTSDEIKVYNGSKVVFSGKTKLGPAVAGKVYSVRWTPRASLAGRTLRFCVRSRDPSGNRSGWSCDRVAVR